MLRPILERFGKEYLPARQQPLTGHSLAPYVRKTIPLLLQELLREVSTGLNFGASVGQSGWWADVPWIAVRLDAVTTTNQEGYYVVYLFSADMQSVYLCLGQGVTAVQNDFKDWRAVLRQRSHIIRERLPEYKTLFVSGEPDFKGSTSLAKSYPPAIAFSKEYDLENLPTEEQLSTDLLQIIKLYRILHDRGGTDLIEDISTVFGDEDIPESVEERKKYVLHKKIERKSHGDKVKKRQGYICKACGFDFKKHYGEIGANFIEAHHLVPLSELKEGEARSYDLEKDFVVLCANCHRMIHKKKAPRSFDDFMALIKKTKPWTLD